MIKKNTGENLLRYHWKDYKFCAYDYETESLNLAMGNLTWEIGYMTMENGKETRAYNRNMLWEDLKMSADAARITQFSWANYKAKAEDPRLVLKEFEEILYDKNTVNLTYNGLNFDIYLHQLWRKKLGLEVDWSFLARSIDILALSRAYLLGLEPPESWRDFFFWQKKLINYMSDDRTRKAKKSNLGGSTTLKAMAKNLDIRVDDSKTHQGLYDVQLTWQVFEKLLWKMELTTEHLGIK